MRLQQVKFLLQSVRLGNIRSLKDVDDRSLVPISSLSATICCLIEVREELVIFFLSDRIVFMIVALSTFHAESHPHHRCCLHAIDHVFHTVLFFDQSAFVCRCVVAQKSSGDFLLRGRIRQQITGQLLDGKLVEWLVAVISTDNPVTPRPHIARAVRVKHAGVAVARRIHPDHRHAFAKVR